ncbi:uncharacterized protein LOC126426686 [Schistocerca serialis cubense]|uniref:uncharacterized protein LOC126426686 n=1 Tax=Schistocerca serialis cubense TaxID=2023355 RepID=UPI00214EF032|nr:uncharacterized protein LOC126426686 [Schistocerca serialis cubense]XP_049944547.1 uncharacterized protein LOC126426686 [Schistocerca serialis cubense]XP_049944548.1 uncharacterized protein LOC126426686 [Schistocerca serialis cubense]XP_049944549.1 uncharacterized protein LOC126426686 [Schistocerca serialis cubense]XP_049944550.1 uncharacterized protein LOC126426686 [Schistocerca serialis cubense]XP_049944551.1 uncharacterized protein LOC126426686 [Schistocerca serialis cubense]XP_04994455
MPTTVVKVYMPASSADDDEIEEMYDEIKDIIEVVKGDENLIVMGARYSVVGKGREGNVVGECGLGVRNERGSRLVEFCTEHNLIIANTWFKNHERRLYTWKNPGDTERCQIDYIMVRQRFSNQVLNCMTFPGADVDSNHNLLVMNCRLKLKKLQKGGNLRRWDLDELTKPEVVQSFRDSVREQLTGIEERNTVEEEWVALRDEVVKAAEDQVGKKTRASRNPWVTEEILNLIDERRKYKNAVNEASRKEYKRLKNEIDRKCKMAKQGWLEDKCKDVEAYLTRGKIGTAYRKIKETFGERRTTCMNIKSFDGNPVLSKEGKAERWKEYIEGQYKGDILEDNMMEMEEDVDEDEMGDTILHEEFDRALKDLTRNKAPGVDNIPLELLTALGEPVLTKHYHLVSKMYETGEVPSDFKKNIIIPIPKKAGVDRCENYRTNSLISHSCKILTRILYRRMEKW